MGLRGRYALLASTLTFAPVERPGPRKKLHLLPLGVIHIIAPLFDFLMSGVGIMQRALCNTGLTWLVFADSGADCLSIRRGG
jgi:hypothetical protein